VVEGAGDVELAASLSPGVIHLIVGGHTHNSLNEEGLSPQNIVNGIPIVQAGKFGQFVGEVEISVGATVADWPIGSVEAPPFGKLRARESVEAPPFGKLRARESVEAPPFDRLRARESVEAPPFDRLRARESVEAPPFDRLRARSEETVEVTHVRLRATVELPTDEAFARAHVLPLLAQVTARSRRVLGRVAPDDDLSADAARSRLAAGESAFANFVADALVSRCRAAGHPVDFAMIDATSINDGLRPGAALTLGDWFNVMPFADTVCLLRLTGLELAALLADNARRTERPGEPHTNRGFLHFSAAVRYIIRLGPSRAAAAAEAITVDGRPLAASLERAFLIAATSFLRGPAAAWEEQVAAQLPDPPFDLAAVPRGFTGLPVRDLLLDHIAAHGGVLPAGGARRDGRVQILP
jgi:hypothetical protein